MGLLDTFRKADEIRSFDSINEETQTPKQGEWDRPADDPHVWLDRYQQFVDRPRFNPNIDGYISPYANGHWGASSDIMQSIAARMELGPIQERLDPNKIFTSDIAALRTLAADQIKIVRVFEHKLMESLTDKGKFGLNEDDIEAMQALTSARSAITAINKEQVAIKKSIAELKMKQQQQGQAGPTQGPSTRPANTFDVGRSIMDQIFDVSPAIPRTDISAAANYPTIDPDQTTSVLDNIITDGQQTNTMIQFESDNPTTYVLLGDSDDDVDFVTYSSDGEILADYPKPSTKIQTIDRETKEAVDELLVRYPIKFKD